MEPCGYLMSETLDVEPPVSVFRAGRSHRLLHSLSSGAASFLPKACISHSKARATQEHPAAEPPAVQGASTEHRCPRAHGSQMRSGAAPVRQAPGLTPPRHAARLHSTPTARLAPLLPFVAHGSFLTQENCTRPLRAADLSGLNAD
ncbi:hypothetical protein NDU88_001286 [Pleurodeles waltl]|uniref:Uncharacterized protein n=1 Tax=Pleurodeles waltl TaxID=8319 RepID=A0AAV7S9P6_PLEWA|nr:hypothetical protein NDU88_001286 [Pleurodeles waltl]